MTFLLVLIVGLQLTKLHNIGLILRRLKNSFYLQTDKSNYVPCIMRDLGGLAT